MLNCCGMRTRGVRYLECHGVEKSIINIHTTSTLLISHQMMHRWMDELSLMHIIQLQFGIQLC